MRVQKIGRTTGHTKDGIVVSTCWNGYIKYGRGMAFFRDCIVVEKMHWSLPGDSGSPVFTQTEPCSFIGLLFAGSYTHSVICKSKYIECIGEVTLAY